VKKISAHITKKVADKLSGMFKKDREDFEKKWDDIKVFIEYGMLTDDKFFEKMQPALLFKNTEGAYKSIEEYREFIKEKQSDKNNKLVHLYTTDAEAQHAYIESAKKQGYDVLVLDSPLTSHFVQQLEMKLENVSFVRVDADTIDKLIEKENAIESHLSDDEKNALTPVFEKIAGKEKFSVQYAAMHEEDEPVRITRPEFMRRMKEQQEMGGGGMFAMGNFPEMYNLVINSNHKLISRILAETDENKKESLVNQAVDLARLAQGMLKGQELTNFIKRSAALID
jgi:molecular chaperone HtpG